MNRHLYVVLSRTDTGMGRLIRFCTKNEYNHVSLCVDDDLRRFVSFARYFQDIPLAGGYVPEPPERLLSCGKTLPVKIFKLRISAQDAEKLEALFALAGNVPLIYNSIGALLNSCHIRYSVPGAYTCLEFTGTVLGKHFCSLRELEEDLEPWSFFQGDLFQLLRDSGCRDDRYFTRRGFYRGTYDTAIHFKRLLWRILRFEKPQDPVASYTFNILEKIPQSSQ